MLGIVKDNHSHIKDRLTYLITNKHLTIITRVLIMYYANNLTNTNLS